MYLNMFKTDEVRQIIFLLNFRNEILGSNVMTQEEGLFFVKFANEVKVPFKEPQKIVEIILNYRQAIVDRESKSENKRRVDQMIIKFICDFIIDSAEEDQEIDPKFMIESIIKELIITDDLKLTPLQFASDFKNNLPKLLDIILKNISVTTYLHFLNENQNEEEKEEEEIDENEENSRDCFSILDTFILEAPQLKHSDPMIVTLNDLIEVQYNEESPFDDQIIEKCLASIKLIVTQSSISQVSLKKIVAISTFKKIVKFFVQDLQIKFTANQNPYYPHISQQLEQFFDFASNIEKEQLFPFAIYIMKLLHSKLDILGHHSKFFVENNPWATKYISISVPDGSRHASFAYLNDNQYVMAMRDMHHKLDQVDIFLKECQPYPPRKMAAILKSIELTYFVQKSLQDEKLLKTMTQEGNENQMDSELQFLRPFYTLQFEQFQGGRNRFIRINDKDNTQAYYIKLIWIFLGAACHSGDTFMSQFFLNPDVIKDCYVPFVQNIKMDSQANINSMEDLTLLRCKFCQNSIFVIQLPASKREDRKGRTDDSKKKKVLGKKICNSCRANDFNGGKFEFTEDTDIQKETACKSYVVLNIKDKKQYQELRVRDLSVQELCIGRIILHSIMMLTVIFSRNKETEIFDLIKGTAKAQSDQYRDTLTETLAYFGKTITYDWKTLRKIWCVNDDKVLQIIQQVILGIVKDSNKFKFDANNLQHFTTSWRDQIELNFKSICQEILKDRNKFFTININPQLQGELQLLELDQISGDSYQNLLRIQNKITIKQFSMTLRDQQHMGENFFKMLFEHTQVVQSIQYLKPLLNWAMFIQNKFNAQLTLEEANDTSIGEIIEREKRGNTGNYDYINKVYKRYNKFEAAWNQFAGITIRDSNVEATIPHITLDSKIMYCCLSSSSHEHDNYIFFLLVKYLAMQQNKLLNEAEAMMTKENDFIQREESKQRNNSIALKITENRSQGYHTRTNAFPKIHLTELKSDQIVYFRECPVDKQLSPSAQKKPDQEKEKLEKIIIKNSACKFEYGRGKQIEFNFAHIKKASVELLLQGKSKIDFTTPINFQFINAGNLFSLIGEISRKIPQKYSESCEEILRELKKDPDVYNLYQEMKICLNYMHQSEFRNLEYSLQIFMKDFSLKVLDQKLFEYRQSRDLSIRNAIQLFEGLEDQISYLIIENVNPQFKEPLEQVDSDYFEYIMTENFEFIKPVAKALQKLIIRMMCSDKVFISDDTLLMEYLFDFKNEYLIEQYSQWADINIIVVLLSNCRIKITQAYECYLIIARLSKQFKKPIKQYIKFITNLESQNNQSHKNQIDKDFEIPKVPNPDAHYLIEDLIIIGEDVTTNRLNQLQEDEEINVDSANFHMFRQQITTECAKRQSARKFCFPSGIIVKRINKDQVSALLSSQPQSYSKEQSFVFTLENQEEPAAQDRFIYCLCVVRDDLMVIFDKNKKPSYFQTQRGYCVMSKFQYHDIHLQIINSVINLQTLEKMQILKKNKTHDNSKQKAFQMEIKAISKTQLINSQITKYIEQQLQYVSKTKQIPLGQDLLWDQTQSLSSFQKRINDLLWYCPQFIKMILPDQFIKVWQAILLEQPILFISDDSATLCAASIGMQCFIDPLKWQQPYIPILPESMEDILQSPVPIITGILRTHLDKICENNPELVNAIENDIIIVNIDLKQNNIQIANFDQQLDAHLNNFKEEVAYIFSQFYQGNNLNQSLVKLYQLCKMTILSNVFYKLPVEIINGKRKWSMPTQLQQIIIQNTNNQDKHFIERITSSQMCTYYLDTQYCEI